MQSHSRGSLGLFSKIPRQEGLLRLYKKLVPQAVKVFLFQGLMMMLKERYDWVTSINAAEEVFQNRNNYQHGGILIC